MICSGVREELRRSLCDEILRNQNGWFHIWFTCFYRTLRRRQHTLRTSVELFLLGLPTPSLPPLPVHARKPPGCSSSCEQFSSRISLGGPCRNFHARAADRELRGSSGRGARRRTGPRFPRTIAQDPSPGGAPERRQRRRRG